MEVHKVLIIEDSENGERFVPLFGRWVLLSEAQADFETEFDEPVIVKLSRSDLEKLNILRGWKFSRN